MKTNSASIHVLHADPTMAIGLHAILSAKGVWTVRRGKLDIEDFSTVGLFVTDYSTGMRLARVDGSGVPVLIVTQRDKEWEVRTALECGVAGYLLQSCEPREVVRAARLLMAGESYLSEVLSQRVADSLGRAALTRREYEVLQLLAEGYCNKLIARRLGIEVGTVKTHVKGLMSKLDASARTHAVMIAAERGLVTAGQHVPQATRTSEMLC